jgi:uncharacterized phage-like protein YoqJ
MQSLDSALIDLRYQTHRELVYRPFQFNKRNQLLISVHNAVIRVYDAAGNVIETHEAQRRFQRAVSVTSWNKKPPCGEARRLIALVG